jgi:beta-barrel assembly-enhancing protease
MSAFSNAAITAAWIVCSLTISPVNAAASASSPSSSSSSATTVKTYHDGSRRDLDDIGNRNVGCGRGIGNWYSIEKQIAMGRSYAQQVESTVKLVKDPVITEYINRLGQNLVRNSDSQVPFTIRLIDSDNVNAFALPGGFFYVDSALILAADNEAELAGVMAHEIAHVAACHAARENTRGQLMNLASIPLVMVGGPVGYTAYEGAGLALPMTFLKFTRGFESEADYLGVEYMYKAGYDPQAFVTFFEKIAVLEKHKPGAVAKAFSTHPQTPDRVEKTQQEISTLLPERMQYKLDTAEFEDVKARLAELENRHVLPNQNDERRPTLRRASPNDKNGDDDRPVLKRRDDNDDLVSPSSRGA